MSVLLGIKLTRKLTSKCTVESSEKSQLVSLQVVVLFGYRCCLIPSYSTAQFYDIWRSYHFDNLMNQLLRHIDTVLVLGDDQTVKVFFKVRIHGSVAATFTFLNRSFSTDGNLGTRFGFHFFQCISTRSN